MVLKVKINTGGLKARELQRALKKSKIKGRVSILKNLKRDPKNRTVALVSGKNLDSEDVREAIEDNVGVQINEIDEE